MVVVVVAPAPVVVVVGAVDPVAAPSELVCAPPPTEPLAASCCCTACARSGEVGVAVQFGLPPVETERMLIDPPQTLAAMLIGICALMGMFALSTLRSSARLLSTFERLTFTSDGTLETPEAREIWEHNCAVMAMVADAPLGLDLDHGVGCLPLSEGAVTATFRRLELHVLAERDVETFLVMPHLLGEVSADDGAVGDRGARWRRPAEHHVLPRVEHLRASLLVRVDHPIRLGLIDLPAVIPPFAPRVGARQIVRHVGEAGRGLQG